MVKLLMTLVPALLALVLVAGPGSAAPAKPLRGVYVGRVAGTHAFVAVAVGHGQARAYLCDSRRLAVWLPLGKLRGTSVNLDGSRVRLTGSVGRTSAQGTVTLADGTRHAFHALLAPRDGAVGLYRGQTKVNGKTYVAGWILLRRGAQRGNVLASTPSRSTTIALQAPALNPEEATVQVTEGSVATVVKLGDSFISKTSG
jgi:hypothetical protein